MPLGAAKPNRVDLLGCVTRSIPLNQNPESENEHVVSPVWLAHTHTAMALTRVQKPLIVLQGHIFLILRDYRTRNVLAGTHWRPWTYWNRAGTTESHNSLYPLSKKMVEHMVKWQ